MPHVQLIHGDCVEKLKELPDCSIDSIVTDPPYGLSFMGKKWDYDVPSVEVWAECLRVLKPGGHLLAFAGTRTQHRMAVRIEDAGFEIRDMIAWVYGSGFPKSLDVSKAIDKASGADREVVGISSVTGNRKSSFAEQRADSDSGFYGKGKTNYSTSPATEDAKQWAGWGTALKPALEPITLARKPLIGTVVENVLTHGTGGLNIDQCRVHSEDVAMERTRYGGGIVGNGTSYEMPDSKNAIPPGRFPANLIHDGSEEVVGLFPNSKSTGGTNTPTYDDGDIYGKGLGGGIGNSAGGFGDNGSAARFFYCAKSSKRDRDEGLEGFVDKERRAYSGAVTSDPRMTHEQNRFPSKNHHPTVKPTDLMRYLCRLVTPPNGTVLDPFMGSGSTGKAAKLEGFSFIGIEREQEYVDIAKARIDALPQTLL